MEGAKGRVEFQKEGGWYYFKSRWRGEKAASTTWDDAELTVGEEGKIRPGKTREVYHLGGVCLPAGKRNLQPGKGAPTSEGGEEYGDLC